MQNMSNCNHIHNLPLRTPRLLYVYIINRRNPSVPPNNLIPVTGHLPFLSSSLPSSSPSLPRPSWTHLNTHGYQNTCPVCVAVAFTISF